MGRLITAALLLTAFASPALAAGDPFGTWATEDGRARVRMERCGATGDRLCGYVVWLKEPKYDDGGAKVDKYNPDPLLRSRLALGHQLLKGLPLNEDGRYAGKIYNADNGKSYDVTIWSEAPGELSLRGCLIAMLCKTQTWARTNDVIQGQLAGATGTTGGPRPDADTVRPVQTAKQAPPKARTKAPAGEPAAPAE